jgi:hypothetical protein
MTLDAEIREWMMGPALPGEVWTAGPAAKPAALYRMFDTDGVLLYVGVTASIGGRVRVHNLSERYRQVTTITLEWFGDRLAAEAAELDAIAAEHPRWNVAGRQPEVSST